MSYTQISLLEEEGDSSLSSIKGTLERITFTNPENGYSIFKFKHADLSSKNNETTSVAIGTMLNPQVGAFLELKGKWVSHPKFGMQFKFSSFEEQRPETLEGMRMFLASGIIKGMGKVWANRLVDHFGLDTFTVLDNEPDRLLEIPRIKAKLIDSIKTSWAEQQGIRDLMVFLNPHGIGPALAVKIYRLYGHAALDIVQENPYRIAMDIRGIGFETADRFALSSGFERNSILRAQAGTLYILLEQLKKEGHAYFPKENLIACTASNLQIDTDIIEEALDILAKEERVILEAFEDHTAVYFTRYHHCETKITYYITRLLNSPKVVHFANPIKEVEAVLKTLPITLAPEQEEAIYTATKSKLMVLTGGPGTGKTTIIKAIIKVFQREKAKIFLAAPTGRAAKRMTETTDIEAKTIHRLLEYNPNQDMFTKNEDNPLYCSLLIVDEASMIDLVLMYHLLKAVPLGCTVIFVGDIHQLPSVGAGNVLRDFINSKIMPVVELNQIFRQAAKSQIIQNAHKINTGEMPSLTIDKTGLSDFYFLPEEGDNISQKTCKTIVDLVRFRLPKKYKFNPFYDIQVLSPMGKGNSGVNNLNKELQLSLNPEGDSVMRGDRVFRVKDKVMQIKNNYDKDIYNGDIGLISNIDFKEKCVLVRYDDDRFVPYLFDELDELVLAYAISIHKSQGGEYPCVIIPLLMEYYHMLERNLLYTAVTRGKKLVVIVGSKKAMRLAIDSNTMHKRYTHLLDRLTFAYNGLVAQGVVETG